MMILPGHFNKEAALKLGFVSGEEFDRLVDPYKMAYPDD